MTCRRPPTPSRWRRNLRPDVAENAADRRKEALAGGPKTEAGMFVAPRILGT